MVGSSWKIMDVSTDILLRYCRNLVAFVEVGGYLVIFVVLHIVYYIVAHGAYNMLGVIVPKYCCDRYNRYK